MASPSGVVRVYRETSVSRTRETSLSVVVTDDNVAAFVSAGGSRRQMIGKTARVAVEVDGNYFVHKAWLISGQYPESIEMALDVEKFFTLVSTVHGFTVELPAAVPIGSGTTDVQVSESHKAASKSPRWERAVNKRFRQYDLQRHLHLAVAPERSTL